jgi:mRNA interferase MazF
VALKLIRRGDIYLINYRPDGREGEAAQVHPGVVVSNNTANAKTHLLMTIPMTSNVERLFITDVFLPNQRTGLNYDSKVQVEAMRATHVSRFVKRLGFVPDDLMEGLDNVIRMHLSL